MPTQVRSDLAQALHQRFRDKKDLMRFATTVLVSIVLHLPFQFLLLPRENCCPVTFLQQVVCNEKSVLTQASCSMIQVPNLPELSLKKQWPIFNAHIPNFRSFMPENWYENPEKRVDRVFMWRIASYLDKHYVCMVIEEVRSLR